jgi:type III secretion protein S
MIESADFVSLAVKGLYLSLVLSMPMVAAAAIIGTLMAVIQALTQIQEHTLGYAVKLIATAVALMLTLNWIGNEILQYTRQLFDLIPFIGR